MVVQSFTYTTMNKNKTPMVLDVDKAHFTPDGMDGFWWPVPQAFLHEIRHELLANLREYHNSIKDNDSIYAQALSLVYVEIVREILVILRSHFFLQAATSQNKVFEASDSFQYLQALKEGKDITAIIKARFSYLQNAQANVPAWKRQLRRIKFFYENNFKSLPYKRRTIKALRNNETLIFSASPFMLGHMKRVPSKNFALCSLWEWFDIPSGEIPSMNSILKAESTGDSGTMITIFDVLSRYSETLDQNIVDGIRAIVKIQTGYAQFYLGHLENLRQKGLLPKEIWFGSTNSFFIRMIRQVIHNSGGKSVGHDHGRGFGMGINYGELGTIFDFCDEFVTYSDFMASELDNFSGEIANRSLNNSIKFSGQGGIIVTPEAIENYRARLKPSEPANKKKTALIMMPVMIKEHIAGLNVLPPDHVFCDFYARLIKHFNDLDYHVIMKRHPEIKLIPNESLFHGDDVECVGGFVENMLHDVDLLVFDFLSSAFKTQIMTDKAMMFLDFGYTKMAKDTRSLFEGRVSVIPCGFDSENRAQFDEALLEPAVQNAQNIKNDTKFRDIVFGVKDKEKD